MLTVSSDNHENCHLENNTLLQRNKYILATSSTTKIIWKYGTRYLTVAEVRSRKKMYSKYNTRLHEIHIPRPPEVVLANYTHVYYKLFYMTPFGSWTLSLFYLLNNTISIQLCILK